MGIRPQICYSASQIDAWMMVSWACRLVYHVGGLLKWARQVNPIETKKVNAHRELQMKTSGHPRDLRNLGFMGMAFLGLGLRLGSDVWHGPQNWGLSPIR